MKQAQIEISHFELNSVRFPEIDFKISCSKGTYIRSIANDFGEKLNSGATLIALRRESSGDFHIQKAKSVDEWIEFINDSH
jgi:tRNA pseudouridine55 synthase